jgi:iron complex transport system substrate-binding protein
MDPNDRPRKGFHYDGTETSKKHGAGYGPNRPRQMNDLRLISFLPAATEMACALGMEEQIVGISHECDFPVSIQNKQIVVRCSLPTETMTLAEIDVAVAERIRSGQPLYEVDQSVV